MPLATPKKLYQFFTHSWDDARAAILQLRDFDWARVNGKWTAAMEEYARLLGDFVADHNEADPEWPVDKACLFMFDPSVAKRFLQTPQDPAVQEDLYIQLGHVVAMTVTNGKEELYTPDQVRQILSGEMGEYNFIWFAYTLRQAELGQDRELYSEILLSYFSIEQVQSRMEFVWQEAVYYMLMLQILWSQFSHMDAPDQEYLLEQYFYRALVVGVPLRERLQYFLYIAPSVYDYVILDYFCVQAIDKNKEVIPQSTTEDKNRSLAEVLRAYENRAGEDIVDGFKQQAFVESIYGNQPGRDAFVAWLQELLYIATHVKRGSLIDHIEAEEITPLDIIQQDISNLFHWFFDQKLWPKMAVYFKKEKTAVNLNTFILYCTDIYDLNKDETVQKFLSFTQFLRDEQILGAGEEVVEFHEEDGTFYWNTGVNSSAPNASADASKAVHT